MNLIKIREKLTYLHFLIYAGSTGPPERLAKKLGITSRSLSNYIHELRLMGAEIHYCRKWKTYYYKFPVVFKFGFESDENVNEKSSLPGASDPVISINSRQEEKKPNGKLENGLLAVNGHSASFQIPIYCEND